jgi:hypothetical protein
LGLTSNTARRLASTAAGRKERPMSFGDEAVQFSEIEGIGDDTDLSFDEALFDGLADDFGDGDD